MLVVLASGHGVLAQPAQGIARVAWLQGCWEASSTEQTIEEQWMVPRGGSMIGVSRTVRGGTLAAYELIVLEEQGDRLAYRAHPSGQPSATFLSTHISHAEVVFENPQHDFPQQIGYQLKGDSLLAWIAGTGKGKPRRVEFPYRRVACAAR